MSSEKTSLNYGNNIIHEAYSETGTWTTIFHENLLKTISKMSKREAILLIKILMDEILQKNSTSFVQFKLCQVYSIIKSRQLDSFQNSFHTYKNKFRSFFKTNQILFLIQQ
jgi:hypothetical protein